MTDTKCHPSRRYHLTESCDGESFSERFGDLAGTIEAIRGDWRSSHVHIVIVDTWTGQVVYNR